MIRKQFFKYVIPCMFSFAFSGVYSIVDGFFVGRNVGDAGLAAVNIAYPLVALILAVGTGIGLGGAVQCSVCMGKNDGENQKKYFGNTVTLLLISSVFVTAALYFASPLLLRLFGAEGTLLKYAEDYIKIISLGAAVQIFSTGMVPIIRNYNGALIAMGAMGGGFVANVILDYLFVQVFKQGVAGAALATVLGQIITVIPCAIFILAKKNLFAFKDLKLSPATVKKIIAVGLSPFGLTLSPNIVIIIMNKGALIYGGETAVACYAVISYVFYSVQLLLQGVGDGSQPLISVRHGAGDIKAVKTVRTMAYALSAAIAVAGAAALLIWRRGVAVLFGMSGVVADMTAQVMPIFVAGLLFVAFLRVTTSYFYAKKRNLFAYILIYGEPAILLVLILILPRFFDIFGVWVSVPISQLLLTGICSFLLVKESRLSHGIKSKGAH